ncbi:MAG: helix-turn-helix domain-containing protein [Actinobacteria bacterium]|nr:helix-turn-helix domain-containing protein [Actinomycetota bacterium]
MAKTLREDLAQARAVYHPLRFSVLVRLMKKPGTVKQVAEAIGESPNRLYYHFKLLEEHGLIRVSGTRIVSGIVEKEYESVPGRYKLSSIAGEDLGGMSGVFGAVLQDAFTELGKALERDHQDPDPPLSERPLFHWSTVALTQRRERELRQRIGQLVQELAAASQDEADEKRPIGIMLALYPAVSET